MVEKITGDSSQSSISVKMGTYVNGLMDAGSIITKITDPNIGTGYQTTFGTYINGKLDAGTMITKITDPNVGSAYQASFGTYLNGKLDAGVMVQKINDNTTTTILGSKVTIGNSNKTVDGKFEDVEVEIAGKVTAQEVAATYATISELNAQKARFDNLESPNGGIVGIYSGSVNASDTITAPTLYANSSLSIGTGTSGGSGSLYYRGTQYFRQAIKMGGVAGSIALGYFLGDSTTALNLDHYHSISAVEGTGANAGKILLTLGAPQLSAGTANFNIAATQYYQDGVAAAQEDGWALAYGKVTPPGQGTGTSFAVQVPDETYNTSHTYTFTLQKGATPGSSGYASVALSGVVVGRIAIGDWYDAGESAGETAGKNAVTITKGSWNQGIISFTKSEGTASTKSVQLCATSPSWNGNTATVQIWDGTAADAQHGSNTGYTVTVTAPDQTVYYWENNTRYSFPSGGKRLSGGVDIMVGTSTSNRYWVLYPTATTLSSAWSGSGDTQTYTLTGDNVNSKSMSLTYTESAWSNGSKTITVTSSDKPNDNRVFQHTVTAPSASISTSWSSSGSGTYQYTYTASTSSDSKSMTIQNVYLLELSGNILASGDEYYQHGEASLKISDNGSTVYKNHIDCYGGVDVTAAVNFGRNLGGGAWYVWDNGTQYDPPSGDIDVYAGHDIMVGTSLSNRKWVIAHNTVTTMQPDGAVYNYSTHPSWGTFYIKVSVGGRWYEMQCYATQSYNSL